MKDITNLCAKCWGELGEEPVCEICGHDNNEKAEAKYLQPKTILEDKYAVGVVDRVESDSVTYIGLDLQLDKKIEIREFYPSGIANRLEGNDIIHIRQKYVDEYDKLKKAFYKLWTTIEKLQGLSAIVPAYDVFEANGTVYAIIEKSESISLREYLLRNESGYIQWDSARIMLMPVLTTIETLHQNSIIHGSITPDNLLLFRDGKVKLKPFTIQDACESKSVLEFNFTDGYTALEQYDNNHKVCPATDIYSFSAVVYRTLVGTNPPDAISREANDKLMIPNAIAETIPMHVIKALGSGLQIYPEKRTKSIADFREQLDASPTVQAKAAAPIRTVNVEDATHVAYEDITKPANNKKKNVGSTIAIIVLVILIIGAIIAGVFVIKQNEKSNNAETQVTVQDVEYQVPNFSNVGYTKSDIENNAAWNEQFDFSFVFEYSKDAEEGLIFKQSVKAGEKVKAKTTITLTVSKGVQTATVPDVSGLQFEDAKKQLEALGFTVSSVEVFNDGSHQKGQVKPSFASAPAAGEVVAVGTEVVVQVFGEVQETTTNAQ